MRFQREREGFLSLKTVLQNNTNLKTELTGAINEICTTYDTSVRENRFITGSVIEFIIGTTLRAAGVSVRHRGARQTRLDLQFENNNGGYSVKALIKSSQTHLVNVLGQAAMLNMWQEGTIFVIKQFGLVYADPDLPWWLAKGLSQIKPAHDALRIRKTTIQESVYNDMLYYIPIPTLAVAEKESNRIQIASSIIASQILVHYETLFPYFPALQPGDEMRKVR